MCATLTGCRRSCLQSRRFGFDLRPLDMTSFATFRFRSRHPEKDTTPDGAEGCGLCSFWTMPPTQFWLGGWRLPLWRSWRRGCGRRPGEGSTNKQAKSRRLSSTTTRRGAFLNHEWLRKLLLEEGHRVSYSLMGPRGIQWGSPFPRGSNLGAAEGVIAGQIAYCPEGWLCSGLGYRT